MSKFPLIIFEGIECSGKTTQIKKVTNFLKKKKINFIKIREPGGTPNSEKIRKVLLNKKSKFNILTDLLMYMASRNENVVNILNNNYKKKVILIDRFISSIAYQHYGMNIDLKLINLLNKKILKKVKPTYIFLHIVGLKNMKKRLKLRVNNNRYDKFNVGFYNKVQKGFLKLLKNKKNVTIVDSNKSIKTNTSIIIEKLNQLL